MPDPVELQRARSSDGVPVAWEQDDADPHLPVDGPSASSPTIDYGARTALGEVDDTEATGDGSIIALLKRLRSVLSDVLGELETPDTVTVDNFPSTYPLSAGQIAQLQAVTAAITNFPDEYPLPEDQVTDLTPQTDALTNTELRAADVEVADDFDGGEALADQSGAGAVLTFTFASAVQLVWVESDGEDLTSRADPFGGTPAATTGIPCRHQVPVPITVTTSEVKVYAPAGTTVSVWGYRRA